MIGITPSLPIYLYPYPTDMRKSFSGLCGIVINAMNRRPEDGHLYVFVNKRRNRMKLLLWDRHGFWQFYKRLELGRFSIPSENMVSDFARLLLVLEGIELSGARQRKRFSLK